VAKTQVIGLVNTRFGGFIKRGSRSILRSRYFSNALLSRGALQEFPSVIYFIYY
jgi:hypothetical protein